MVMQVININRRGSTIDGWWLEIEPILRSNIWGPLLPSQWRMGTLFFLLFFVLVFKAFIWFFAFNPNSELIQWAPKIGLVRFFFTENGISYSLITAVGFRFNQTRDSIFLNWALFIYINKLIKQRAHRMRVESSDFGWNMARTFPGLPQKVIHVVMIILHVFIFMVVELIIFLWQWFSVLTWFIYIYICYFVLH